MSTKNCLDNWLNQVFIKRFRPGYRHPQALLDGQRDGRVEMSGIEFVKIDLDPRLDDFKKELRWNYLYYLLAKGL